MKTTTYSTTAAKAHLIAGRLLPVAFAFFLTACTSQPSKGRGDFMKDFLAPAFGKTAAFAIGGDSASQHRLEAQAVAQMHKMGFDGVEGHPLIPAAQHYNADDLAKILQQIGVQSIAAVRPKVKSNEVDFDIQALVGSRYAHYPTTDGSLAQALGGIFQSLEAYGAQAKKPK